MINWDEITSSYLLAMTSNSILVMSMWFEKIKRLPLPDWQPFLYHQNHITIQTIFYSNSIKTHPDALIPNWL